MKIITKNGIDMFNKTFNTKLIQGKVDTVYLSFRVSSPETIKKIVWACRDKQVEYYLQEEVITLKQKELLKLLPENCSEEKRIWKGKDKLYICSEMDQQHLSNILFYLEILLTLGKINKKDSENYLIKVQEVIIPELEERFNGETLEYKPHYEYEKELYKEYLKIKGKQKK